MQSIQKIFGLNMNINHKFNSFKLKYFIGKQMKYLDTAVTIIGHHFTYYNDTECKYGILVEWFTTQKELKSKLIYNVDLLN